MKKILEIKDITKEYTIGKGHAIKACDEISLDVFENEFLSVVGESGSGKSTFLRLITSLEIKTKGEIFFENKAITMLNKKELRLSRKQIQLVFQDTSSALNPKMKVKDIICEGLINFGLITKSEKEEKALEYLKKVELDHSFLQKKASEMSGGERQRVCIARALTLNPKILMLDEPTSALDVITQNKILILLKKLQKENKLTILFVCHDLALVSAFSDRIAVMQHGKLVEILDLKNISQHEFSPYTKELINSAFDIKKCTCKTHADNPILIVGTKNKIFDYKH